jgi:hypothetical protein
MKIDKIITPIEVKYKTHTSNIVKINGYIWFDYLTTADYMKFYQMLITKEPNIKKIEYNLIKQIRTMLRGNTINSILNENK